MKNYIAVIMITILGLLFIIESAIAAHMETGDIAGDPAVDAQIDQYFDTLNEYVKDGVPTSELYIVNNILDSIIALLPPEPPKEKAGTSGEFPQEDFDDGDDDEPLPGSASVMCQWSCTKWMPDESSKACGSPLAQTRTCTAVRQPCDASNKPGYKASSKTCGTVNGQSSTGPTYAAALAACESYCEGSPASVNCLRRDYFVSCNDCYYSFNWDSCSGGSPGYVSPRGWCQPNPDAFSCSCDRGDVGEGYSYTESRSFTGSKCVSPAEVCSGGECVVDCGDADESRSCCEALGGGVWEWGVSGEVKSFGGFTSLGQGGCVGDDAGEFLRFRECLGGVCVTDVADVAACRSGASCVFKGQCFSDIDELVVESSVELADEINSRSSEFVDDFEGLFVDDAERELVKAGLQDYFGDERVRVIAKAAVSGSDLESSVYADVNGDVAVEVCDPGQWQGVGGGLSGVVSNVTSPVEGAVVKVLGTGLQAVTDGLGRYSISNVPSGTTDLVASKPGDGYEDSILLDVYVPGFGVRAQDFVLVHPRDGCNDDCTVADGLCRAECDGKGLCSFASAETRVACDFAAPGIVDYGEEWVACCAGGPFMPVEADVKVCGGTVISSRVPVLFKGRLVSMVLTVFDSAECQ